MRACHSREPTADKYKRDAEVFRGWPATDVVGLLRCQVREVRPGLTAAARKPGSQEKQSR